MGLGDISETDGRDVVTGEGGWEGAGVTPWSLAWGTGCMGMPQWKIQGLRKEQGRGWRFEEGASWGHAALVLLQDRQANIWDIRISLDTDYRYQSHWSEKPWVKRRNFGVQEPRQDQQS